MDDGTMEGASASNVQAKVNSQANQQAPKDENSVYWESGWSCWLTFKEEYGYIAVPDDKPALKRWVRQQRSSYQLWKNGVSSELDGEKVSRMNSEGFRWSDAEDDVAPEPPNSSGDDSRAANNNPSAKPDPGTELDGAAKERRDNETEAKDDEQGMEPDPLRRPTRKRPPSHEPTEQLAKGSKVARAEAQESKRPPTPEMEKMSDDPITASVFNDSPLHHAHFAALEDDPDDAAYIEPVDGDDTESDEEWTSDKKPRAKRKAKSPSPKKPPSSGNPPEAADEADAGRYPRRNRRSMSEGDLSGADVEGSEAKRQKLDAASPGQHVYSVMKVSEKTGKKELRSYEIRNLRRIVPEEEQDKVREECRVEFADLLKSDEILVPDKKRGVDHQTAKSNVSWEANFLEYLVFKKVYGHGIVPKVFVGDPSLGRWTVRNRRWWKSKDSRMSKSRLRRLNAVGFVWEAKKDPAFWAIQQQTTQEEDKWEGKFVMLEEYKKEHGDCLVPKEYAPNMVLARWVGEQRKQMKAKSEGRNSTLNDAREKRLRDLGFVFNTRTREHLRNSVLQRFQDRWDSSFQRLLQFKETYGHAAVPRRWKADKDLASWAMRQRSHGKKYMRGEESYLTKERFELLQSVDFVFEMDRNKYPMDGVRAYKNGNNPGLSKKEPAPTPPSQAPVSESVVEEAVAAAIEAEAAEGESVVQGVAVAAVSEPASMAEELAALDAEAEMLTMAASAQVQAASTNEQSMASAAQQQGEPATEDAKPVAKPATKPAPTTDPESSTKPATDSTPTVATPTRRSTRAAATQRNARPTRQTRKSEMASAVPEVVESSRRTTRQSKKQGAKSNSEESASVDSGKRTRYSKRLAGGHAEDLNADENSAAETEEAQTSKDASQESPLEPNDKADAGSDAADDGADAEEKKADVADDRHEEEGGRSEGEAVQPESNDEIAKGGESDPDLTHEATPGETDAAPAAEEAPAKKEPTPEELQKAAEEALLKANKGKWKCENCGKDEHLSYINFLAHEATCLGLEMLAIPEGTPLD